MEIIVVKDVLDILFQRLCNGMIYGKKQLTTPKCVLYKNL